VNECSSWESDVPTPQTTDLIHHQLDAAYRTILLNEFLTKDQFEVLASQAKCRRSGLPFSIGYLDF